MHYFKTFFKNLENQNSTKQHTPNTDIKYEKHRRLPFAKFYSRTSKLISTCCDFPPAIRSEKAWISNMLEENFAQFEVSSEFT